jgi:hypothetical protein
MYGQIQFSVTSGGSATRAMPPGTAGAVADADAEDDGPVPAGLAGLLHAAIPTASRAAVPATAARTARVG